MSRVERHIQIAGALGRAAYRLVHTEGLLLVLLLGLVVGVWSFIELADEVREGDANTFDEWVMPRLREHGDPKDPIGPAWVEEAAVDITALGGHTVLTFVVLAVAGYLLLARKRHAMWLVLLTSGGGWGVTMGLKELFSRERPQIISHLVEVQTLSFPSGHAMMSAVVYLTLGALLTQLVEQWAIRIYFLAMAVLLTFLVGLSRIFLGVHYPTDVLAGWSAGLAWAILCWLVARWLQRRGVVEKPEEKTEDL